MRITTVLYVVLIDLLFGGCGKSNPANSGDDRIPNPTMTLIPGGTFQMGDSLNSNELPIHSVTISSFYMDVTEVTQGNYDSIMKVNPSIFIGNLSRPVEHVTWYDAVLYCNARSKLFGFDTIYQYSFVNGTPGYGCDSLGNLEININKNGYRLPTEAEWEYACRASAITDYYWNRIYPPTTTGDTLTIDSNAIWGHNSLATTHSVATKKPNAWGLCDMSGNVWEWCNDWYDSLYYQSSPPSNPTGPASGIYRLLRGGSWLNFDLFLRSAYRFYGGPGGRGNFVGFRCVRR